MKLADHEFDRWFVGQLDKSGNFGRKATEEDCNFACHNASSMAGEAVAEVVGQVASKWCVGFEFRRTEKDSMCELYDDCSSQQASQQLASQLHVSLKRKPSEKQASSKTPTAAWNPWPPLLPPPYNPWPPSPPTHCMDDGAFDKDGKVTYLSIIHI